MKALILDKKVTYTGEVFKRPIVIKSNEVELINCSSVGIHGNKLIAVEIACDNYKLEGYTCTGVDIGIIVDGVNCTVEGCVVDGYTEDAIRFCKDGAVIQYNRIVNYNGANGAHHDAIQFYSGDQNTHYSWKGRYELGPILAECKVIGNVISDNSPFVQGIFCSDGLLKNFKVTGNMIYLPNSNHSISIRGLQRGCSIISHNDITGAPMRIEKARRDPKDIGGELKVLISSGGYDNEYRMIRVCTRSWKTLWLVETCKLVQVRT